MKRILLLSMVFSFVLATTAWAQRTVSGKVTDENGEGLPGVNVVIKGTTTGVTTDLDGNFQITVPDDNTVLIFSSVGMADQEVVVGARTSIDVAMAADLTELDEVVVVGYGTTTKQAFAGSLTQVDKGLINRKSVSNLSQALAGEVAGVNVVNTTGQPGASATVRIRGIGSLNGNSAPLYVVDGVPYFGNINAINPADIENMTVLKDATATAIYGSRGANGVILITTRKGAGQEPFIEVDAKVGNNFSILPRYSRISSPDEYIEISWDAMRQKASDNGNPDPVAWANANLFGTNGIDVDYNMWDVANGAELIDPSTGQVLDGVTRRYNPENWEDYAFQPSRRVEGNIRIGGGDEKVNYYTSFGYLNDVGYSINSDFERISTRMSVNHQVRKWISGGLTLGYSRGETNNGGQTSDSGSIFWFVDNIPSIYPLFRRDAEGNKIPDPYYGGFEYDYGESGRGFGALTNAISDAHINTRNTVSHDLNGSANFAIDFTDDLRYETTYGMQYVMSSFDILNSPFYGPGAPGNGTLFKQKTETFFWNFTNLLRYNKTFGAHTIEALVAHESNAWEQQITTGSMEQAVDPDVRDFGNFVVTNPSYGRTDRYSLESVFGQVNYNYESKYYVTASLRRDGSSRFLKDKWGTFGSVGVGWVATNESFLSNLGPVDFLKLKASYGLTGDQAGVGFYPGYDLLSISNLDGRPALAFSSKGNPDLTWETAQMLQFGLEASVGKYVDINIDYYKKTTKDLIFDRRVGPSLGYALIQVNDGNLTNSGLEFDITGHLVKTNDFFVDLRVNGELISNELTQMPIDPATGQPKVLDISGVYGRAQGQSIFDYYMREWAGVNPDNGRAQWYVYYADADDDGELDAGEAINSLTEWQAANPDNEATIRKTTTETYASATEKFVGKSAIPDVRGAINLSAGYKNFSLMVLFRYQIGGYGFDGGYQDLMSNSDIGNQNWHTDIRKRWREPGDITNVPKLNDNLHTNFNSTSTRFLTKADYFTLSNIRLGYTFPQSMTQRMGIGNLDVFVAGDNLFLLSKRDGFNPTTDLENDSNRYTYDPLSTLTMGLNVKF